MANQEMDQDLPADLVGPPQGENDAMVRLAVLEGLVDQLTANRTADWQTISNLQQQQTVAQNTIDQQANTIANLQGQLQGMQGNQNNPVVQPQAQPAIRQKDPGEIIRPTPPELFEGDPKKIQAFFTDMRAYFRYFPTTMATDEMKVRVAGGRLGGAAKDWFEPHLRDFERNGILQRKPTTTALFTSYNALETALKNLFGEEDEKKEAENALLKLHQKGACSKYTAEFIRLSAKTDLEEASKKMLYYQGLKSDVKDDLAREDLPATFEALSQKATRIDNRQFERRMERQREKKGDPRPYQKTLHHANQGKKREEYIAKDNGTKPGRMDLDTINYKKFTGTCRTCGKKGHKEADCRSKLTCTLCNKKGHDEAHCYTRKNTAKDDNSKALVRIDAIAETPHDHLSWTACYDDSCPTHKDSKENSSYFPKKPRAKKSHKTVHIDTLTFNEETSRFEHLDSDDECSQCGTSQNYHAETCKRYADDNQCPVCRSKTLNRSWTGCQFCQPEEWVKNQPRKMEVCPICDPTEPYYGRTDIPHTYKCAKYEPTKTEEYKTVPPRQPRIATLINLSEAYTQVPFSAILDALDDDCGEQDWLMCKSMYCQEHVFDKLEDWHEQQIMNPQTRGDCNKTHFLDCPKQYCTKHVMIKHRFRLLTKKLTKRGYNTISHENEGHGNKTLIKEFHSMIEERIYDVKCKWCYKYQGRSTQWQKSHLDEIIIDSIGQSKKLMIEGYLNQQPVTIYVDSGADRNLITPELISRLDLQRITKPIPSYASSIVHPDHHVTIRYETDHLPLTVAERTNKVKFDMMKMGNCDIMLGYPWLKQCNPLINWKTKEILWDRDVTQKL
jgi:hypothetical protein